MVLFQPNGRPVERKPPTIPSRPRLIATVISCIPDVVYPFDSRVVRWIRKEFDPFMVPVFVKNVYRLPTGGEMVVGHHAAAATYETPMLSGPVAPWVYRTLQPSYTRMRKRPTKVELHFYAKDKYGKQDPNAFVPFEWNIHRFMVSARDEMLADERRQFIEDHDPQKQTDKAVAEADERVAYEERADSNWLARKVDSWDVDTVKRIEATGSDAIPPPSRPSVYVGRKAVSA